MILENKFNIAETVYLKTDQEQKPRLVTGLTVRQSEISYALSCGESETHHYDFEITIEKDVLKTTTN